MEVIKSVLLALITSCLTLLVQYIYLNKGSLLLFYRRVNNSKELNGWGVFQNSFFIPINFDLQNTSGCTKVCRDLSLWLCNDNYKVHKFQQVGHTYRMEGNSCDIYDEKKYGNDAMIYSFVIQPKSVVSTHCFFLIDKNKLTSMVNNVSLLYYDENNKSHLIKLFNINEIDTKKLMKQDNNWIQVK